MADSASSNGPMTSLLLANLSSSSSSFFGTPLPVEMNLRGIVFWSVMFTKKSFTAELMSRPLASMIFCAERFSLRGSRTWMSSDGGVAMYQYYHVVDTTVNTFPSGNTPHTRSPPVAAAHTTSASVSGTSHMICSRVSGDCGAAFCVGVSHQDERGVAEDDYRDRNVIPAS